MPIIDANVDILNEVYFGDDILREAQYMLSKIRTRYKGKAYAPEVNYDKQLLSFTRKLESIFGFYHLDLEIYDDYDFNGMSYSLGDRAAIDKNTPGEFTKDVRYTRDKNGFRYTKGTKYVALIGITYGLICDDRFSDREVMAVILHEVGHNFSRTFIEGGDTYNLIELAIKNIQGMYGILYYNKAKEKLKEHEGRPEYNQVMDEVIKNILQPAASSNNDVAIKFANAFLWAQERIGVDPTEIEQGLKNLTDVMEIRAREKPTGISVISVISNVQHIMNAGKLKRDEEKFANTFASMYGYAKEIGSVNLKIYKYKPPIDVKMYPSKPYKSIRGVIFDLITMPFKLLDALLDPHEESLNQVKTQMEYLRLEIRKLDVDPDIKKELRDQYHYLYSETKDLIDIDSNKFGSKLREGYNKYLYSYFKRDYAKVLSANERLFKNIDKVSEELDIKESSILIEMADPNYIDLEM